MNVSGTVRALLHRLPATLAIAFLLSPAIATAQQSDDSYFRVTPYMWFLGLDGTTAALGQDIDFDASFSDILDQLNIALMVSLEWKTRSNWFFILDPMWADLEADYETAGPLPVAGTVDIDMTLAEGIVGYRFNENFDLYAGARYYDMDVTIVPDGPLPATPIGDDWTDFVLGVRAMGPLGDNWSVAARLDGAAGGDSDSAWFIQAVFMRHFGQNMHLDMGWRFYDVDFESGTGLTRFKWNVEHSGPVIGYSWQF